MKIKFNSDEDLPLNKMLEIQDRAIAVRAGFHEETKFFQQIFIDDCLCKL